MVKLISFRISRCPKGCQLVEDMLAKRDDLGFHNLMKPPWDAESRQVMHTTAETVMIV